MTIKLKTGQRLRRRLSLVPAALLLALIATAAEAGPAGQATRGVAPIRSSMPSHVTVNLPNGESLSLYGNHAVAIYRDGPRPPVDPESSVPTFLQRRLGEMRSSSFVVTEATRLRLARLVLHEIDHPPASRLLPFGRKSPLRVSTYYSETQTGGESRLDTALRTLPDQETTSALVLRDLVQRLLEEHRHDDSL